jgi:hypothetical protein
MVILLYGGAGCGDLEALAGGGVGGVCVGPGLVGGELEVDALVLELVVDVFDLLAELTGFVGGVRNRPSPISTAEVAKIMDQMQAGVDKPKPKTLFEVGEIVRVKEGPFIDFNGNIEEVNYEKSRLRVSVTIFGRGTPVELEFGQVEKM